MPAHPPVVNQLVKDAVRLRVEQSNYDHASNQSLHTMVTQLMADIKRLSEVNANLEDENKSIAHRLDIVEEIVAELRNKTTGAINYQSTLQHLFCQLCGVDCDSKKKNRVAALAAVKPLENREAHELSSEGVRIWHPDWLGNVDDDVNAKFIKEVIECAYNNEKSQREQTQLKSIPDASFTLPIISECAKTYFRSMHKRVKELHSDEGTRKFEARLEYSRQRARHVTVAAARRKAALQYEKESGNLGAEALVDTDLGSDILTCNDNEVSEDTLQRRKDALVGQSANKVIGHAWRSVDYVAFLRWLSLRAMKLQQDAADEPNQGSMDQGPQRKRRRTTKKLHKWVFDVAPKHMNCGPPLSKTTIFKVMVDEGWYKKNPEMVVVEGIDWLKGFYSRLNREDLFEADALYLQELDDYLKIRMSDQSSDEEN